MNELQIFKNDELGQLRVIVKKEDDVYFNLHDTGWALGYIRAAHTGQMYLRKDRIINVCTSLEITVFDRNGQKINITPDLDFEQLYVNEAGLYDLILESKTQKARKFRKWVTSEVLPTIRKTGGYVYNDDAFIETYLPFADDLTKALFKKTLETIRKQNELIKQMKPKAEYFDALVERNLLTNFRNTAKELKVKEREFIQWLLDKGFIYRDKQGNLQPYAQYVPELFEIKEWQNEKTAGIQTLITPKGRETFRLLLKGDEKLG